LNLLDQEEHRLSIRQLEGKLNFSRGKIEKALKLLSIETPSPMIKLKIENKYRYYTTKTKYEPDQDKIDHITEIRRREQSRMSDYIRSPSCLMMFLARELDAVECGMCAVCRGQPLIPEDYSPEKFQEAISFLCRSDHSIEPRKQWAPSPSTYGWRGNISQALRAEPGRALSLWGDNGWGSLVKRGKYDDNCFSDKLVEAMYELIQRWQPDPFPAWMTCVPSLNRPNLVSNFARLLADKLNIPFVPCVSKIRSNKPQKEMQNSSQQARNLDGVFEVTSWYGIGGPVFLIDDMVDSRWTFTVVAALLRQLGSGRVFLVALALNSLKGE